MNTNLKTLVRYIIPALGGLFVTYLYNVVDGIFVGQGIGSAALGAVNIAVPFTTTVVAVTAMFPMGSATVVAIRMGRGGQGGRQPRFHDRPFPDASRGGYPDDCGHGVRPADRGHQRRKKPQPGDV